MFIKLFVFIFISSLANRLVHDNLMQLNASELTGYQKNEFDTSKFTTGLMLRTHSQYDLPSFGLDPDAPVFVNGPYGRGGLQSSDLYQRYNFIDLNYNYIFKF